MWLGMWMTSCSEAMGWGFWVILEKKNQLVEIWGWTKRVDFLDLGEASPVMDYGMPAYCWVRWNSQHSKNCVCLSLSSCWRPKSQDGNESSVPELPRVVSVSSVFFGFLCMWTFHVSVYCTYPYIVRILILYITTSANVTLRSLSDKYFWKRYEPSLSTNYNLNSITAVLLQRWLWH